MNNALENDVLAALGLERIDSKTFAPIDECDGDKFRLFQRVYGEADILADDTALNASNLAYVRPNMYAAYKLDGDGHPVVVDDNWVVEKTKAKIIVRLKK